MYVCLGEKWIGSRIIVKRRLDFANWKIGILGHVLSSDEEGVGRLRPSSRKETEKGEGNGASSSHDRGAISHPLGRRLVA